MMTQRFNLNVILAIISGQYAFCPQYNERYELLRFLEGKKELAPLQLPGARDRCAVMLLEQLPQLGEIVIPEGFEDKASVELWLKEQMAEYGDTLCVASMSAAKPLLATVG